MNLNKENQKANLKGKRTMNGLELFSGSKTVSSVFESYGIHAWSVDNNQKLNPSICCDIRELCKNDLPKYFDIIWASPDCSTFSRSASPGLWNKEVLKYRQYNYTPVSEKSYLGLSLLLTTIEIIKFYNPPVWFIENPVGRMRHIKQLKLLAPFRYSVNYKDWGFDYSKETDIYTNQYLPLPQKKVIRLGKGVMSVNSVYERSRVPAMLINFLIKNSVLCKTY